MGGEVLMLVDLIEAAAGLAALLEASAETNRKRKRRRDHALALGLIGQGPEVAKAIAVTLPKAPARRLRRTIDVSAFQTITPRGALKDPVAIEPGDTLYISRVGQAGTGIVSRDSSRTPYAVAGRALAAGVQGRIVATLYEKLWLTDGNPCDICEENSVAGWIAIDEDFPSGDWEPIAHPNCKCSLEVRRVD